MRDLRLHFYCRRIYYSVMMLILFVFSFADLTGGDFLNIMALGATVWIVIMENIITRGYMPSWSLAMTLPLTAKQWVVRRELISVLAQFILAYGFAAVLTILSLSRDHGLQPETWWWIGSIICLNHGSILLFSLIPSKPLKQFMYLGFYFVLVASQKHLAWKLLAQYAVILAVASAAYLGLSLWIYCRASEKRRYLYLEESGTFNSIY